MFIEYFTTTKGQWKIAEPVWPIGWHEDMRCNECTWMVPGTVDPAEGDDEYLYSEAPDPAMRPGIDPAGWADAY